MNAHAAALSGDETSSLARRFVGVATGAVRIVGARTEARYDANERSVLLELGPLPTGRATSTTDDLFAARQEARHRLGASGVGGVEIASVGGASDADPDQAPDASKSAHAQDPQP